MQPTLLWFIFYPLSKFSCNSTHNVLSDTANRQTNKSRWRCEKLRRILFCIAIMSTRTWHGIDYIGWSDATVIYGQDAISMLWGMTSYCVKLTGKELSRYLNTITPVDWVKGTDGYPHMPILRPHSRDIFPNVGVARALADSSDFGLLGSKVHRQKYGDSLPWTPMNHRA